MYDGIPYKLGTEGAGQQQFARELFAGSRRAINVPGVSDKDLKIFTQDLPFNFTLEQALDSLDDPGALAKVAQLHTLVVRVPVYAELVQNVQELLEAVHKFQKSFSDHTGQTVIQLEATKHQMETAHIWSQTHVTLMDLAHARELQGQFYWPDLPGMLENLRHHYFKALSTAQTVTAYGVETGREQVGDRR